MSVQIEERHWVLWAVRARDEAGRHLGHYRRQPWYRENHAWRSHSTGAVLGQVDPDDDDAAEWIGKAVLALQHHNALAAGALRAHWGAFPRASAKHMERNARVLGLRPRFVRLAFRDAQRWCEQWIAADAERRHHAPRRAGHH